MDKEQLQSAKEKCIRENGPWEFHNIRLADDVFTIAPDVPGVSLRLKRFIQTAADLLPMPFAEMRVLDLASCEGLYAIEFARQGAEVLGIEAREAHLKKARFVKEALNLDRLHFEQNDVRALNTETHGQFDLILCPGIFYHLDTPDLFRFTESIAAACKGIAIFDTHVALQPVEKREYKDHEYWGKRFKEHEEAASEDERMESVLASIDNTESFWLTRASLYNLLLDVGFTSVLESHIPTTYDNPDRITLVARKGEARNIESIPPECNQEKQHWPETPIPKPQAVTLRDRIKNIMR